MTPLEGDVIVYGNRMVVVVEVVKCEHYVIASRQEVACDDLRFAGYVPVWAAKNSPDGDGKPAGAGLNIVRFRQP